MSEDTKKEKERKKATTKERGMRNRERKGIERKHDMKRSLEGIAGSRGEREKLLKRYLKRMRG